LNLPKFTLFSFVTQDVFFHVYQQTNTTLPPTEETVL
jgi:hypothetical protein